MTPQPILKYGLVVASDIEGFSKHDTRGQALLQERLSETLATAARSARLDRKTWYLQARGDGELAVVPPDVDPSWVVGHFTEQVSALLDQLREAPDPEPRLRLRMAMHLGTMAMGKLGPAGEAPIVACRLLDAPSVRRALANDRGTDLVLVVSERLYRDVVTTHFHGLAPELFSPIRVSAKGQVYSGRICAGSPRIDDRGESGGGYPLHALTETVNV